jgi:hypothetical protein
LSNAPCQFSKIAGDTSKISTDLLGRISILFDCLHTVGIGVIYGVIADIGVEIELVVVADRIGLQKPPQRRRVGPGLVIIHAELGQERLAGILEPADIA